MTRFSLLLLGLLVIGAGARAGSLEQAAGDLAAELARSEARIAALELGLAKLEAELAELRALVTDIPPGDGQAPLVDHDLPGAIEAEDFDIGGEGVAYHDSAPGNIRDEYRAEGVDIERTTDSGGGFNVGWIAQGEWLEYTVDAVAGLYDLHLRVASLHGAPDAIQVSLDGAVLATLGVPATGDWQAWTTVSVPGLALEGGRGQVLRIEALAAGWNLNWLEFVRTGDRVANAPPGDLLLLTRACSGEVKAQRD